MVLVRRTGQSMGPLVVDQYLSLVYKWTLEPILHSGILPHPRHMGKVLDPDPNTMTDFEESQGRTHPP